MSTDKYVGMDVHQATSIAVVLDSTGSQLMESILRTDSNSIRDFIRGLSGDIHLTFEEGTQAGWLYDLIKPLVSELIVCNPRRNRLLKTGSKNDRVDAGKLAELLRLGSLKPVYHGDR